MISAIASILFAFLIVFATITWIKRYHHTDTIKPLEDSEPCEFCGYDLRATPDRCPECGHASPLARTRRLREEWPGNPISPRRPEPREEPCVVFNTFSGVLADLLRQHLECRGVECRIARGEGGIDPVSITPVTRAWVLTVWSGDVQLAGDIIHRLLPPEETEVQSPESDQFRREKASAKNVQS